MVDTLTDEEYFFPINRWLAADRDDGQLHRECAVMSPGAAPVPGTYMMANFVSLIIHLQHKCLNII